MKNVLPISRAPQDLLVSREGEPVWPIHDVSDERLLRDLVAVFGCSLQVQGASIGETSSSNEIVLGLGEGLRGWTRLYAHLTKRRAQVISSIRELETVEDAHVLLCGWDQLTFSLLEQVYDYSRNRNPIGLVVADDEVSMRRQVLVRSASASMRGPMSTPAVLVSGSFDFEELAAPGLSFLGQRAPIAALSAALTTGAGTVGMAVHGDGLDSYVGGGKVICAVKGRENLDAARRPDCVAAGYCHRLHMNLRDALADERTISSRELRCRIGVILSCFGIPATQSLVAPHWSLLQSRLERGAVGAIVTPWGLAIPFDDLLLQFTEDLVTGHSVGEAIARSYEYLDEASAINRLCLFGDPRVRLPRAEDSLAAIEALRDELGGPVVEPAGNPPPPELIDVRAARARILAECVGFVRSEVKPGTEDMRLADEAIAALTTLLTQDPEHWTRESIDRASVAALRALARVGSVWKYLSRLGSRVAPVPCSARCRSCARSLRATHRRLDIPGAADRLELWCDRCGVLLDTERDSRFASCTFSFSAGRLVLDPVMRSPEVHAMLVLQAWWHGRAIWELFPVTAHDVTIADAVPGLTIGTILAIENMELIVLQHMFWFASFSNESAAR